MMVIVESQKTKQPRDRTIHKNQKCGITSFLMWKGRVYNREGNENQENRKG
jgi:hypothetical protein